MLISGDRQSEARYLADHVGIDTVHASARRAELRIVRRETALRHSVSRRRWNVRRR
jgi:cation transport ATPase